MFSPQRKSAARGGGGVVSGAGKGKAVSFLDGPSLPPPLLSLSVGGAKTASSEADMEDWRRFKEAGLLDEAAMVRKDHEALADKVTKLETQLFDYQYNMGLLLIEKEEWASKFEELRQELAETCEILKREQTGHLIALSEAEKREDNLRNALVTEKQCVIELEKALREMNQEQAKVRLSSNSMVAEANILINGVGEKSVEIEKKLKAAEAKLAEVNRSCMRLDIRLEEVEARESVLQKEEQTLRIERESQKAIFAKQKEDLQEWEKKLHAREESLCKGRRTLVVREEKENENERTRKQKETELQELEKMIESSNLDLKEKKEALSKQLEELLRKEKEADCLKKSLEKSGEELCLQEDKLRSREQLEVKQLLDEHKATLDMKMQELDLELEEKRKSIDKELSCKADVLRKKEAEVNHREEKLGKREQAMHERSERLKEKNKELDEKLKSMKEKEKVIKAEERKLATEKQQLVADKESLQSLLAEMEKIKDENIQLEQKICEERESLSITNNERSEHVHLHLELKQEMEKYRVQNGLLLEKIEELKQERESFEKQWEDLDEKRSKVSAELEKLIEEKENLEKLQNLEEDRLKKDKLSAEKFIKGEMENLKLEKELFADKMKDEQLALSEKAQLDHSQMVHDFESQRRNLETEMQNQQEKMDKLLRDRERAFEDERERELNNIKHLKEVARKEREEVKSERIKVEKKREELASDKGKLLADQVDMQNDIKQLDNLSKKIKHQREELIRERSQFLAFVEKLKSCYDDKDVARELALSGFQVPEVNKGDIFPPPSLDNEHVEKSSNDLRSPNTVEPMSWLQKCTSKIFNLSPGKKSVQTPTSVELTPSSAVQLTAEEKAKDRTVLDTDETDVHCSSKDRSLGSSRNSNAAAVVQKDQFEKITAMTDGAYAPDFNDHSNLDSKADEVPEDSLQSELKSGRWKPNQRRTSGLHKTRSVQAAVKDAETFLGEMLEEPRSDATIQPSDSLDTGHSLRKRQYAQASHITENEQDGGDSEACSGSVTAGGRGRKRRQTVPSGLQTPGEDRYNFRPRKNGGTAKGAVDSKKTKDREAGASETVEEAADREAASISSSEVARKSSGNKQLAHVTIAKTVEFSENRVVRFITPDQNIGENADAGAEKSIDNAELSVEVNSSAEYGDGDESGSTNHDSVDDQGDEVQPGEVSIGKKLWTFFIT